MIVVGLDVHKQSVTAVAVDEAGPVRTFHQGRHASPRRTCRSESTPSSAGLELAERVSSRQRDGASPLTFSSARVHPLRLPPAAAPFSTRS